MVEVFRLIFKKIPMHMYENFHKMFSGSNQNTFEICRKCGGACEHNKIGTLLPGEKEYMANKMGISISEFKLRYLDLLKMDDGTLVHVLKLGELCPFLNKETEECECSDFKPVICKIFESAIPFLSRFPIPFEWFNHVISYDDLNFDYDQLRKCRKGKGQYAVFNLEELLSLQIDCVEVYKVELSKLEV